MIICDTPKTQFGIALLPVVFISLTLSAFVFVALDAFRHSAREAGSFSDFARARNLSMDGVERLIYQLISGPNDRQLFNQPVQYTAAGFEPMSAGSKSKTTRHQVFDQGGLLQLFPVFPGEWMASLKYLGVEEQLAREVVDRLMDWQDSDSDTRLNGIESRGYDEIGSSYTPRNGPVQSFFELLLIPGLDRKVVESLLPFSAEWGWVSPNPSLAVAPILSAYVSPDEADIDFGELYRNLSPDRFSRLPSGSYRLIVESDYREARYNLIVDIKVHGDELLQYRMVDWR